MGWIREPGFLLIICAVMFNFGLCFINTLGIFRISSMVVAILEAIQMLIGLFVVRSEISGAFQIIAVLGLYIISMKLINPFLDIKLIHDLAIMYIYYMVGRSSSATVASAVLWSVISIILIVSLFELFMTDLYGQYFNIWTYYVDKGAIAANVVNYGDTSLFLSANRPEDMGRSLLPWLFGSHRVSSVFLEPDSMGNFAVILFAWGLSGRFATQSAQLRLFAVSILCVILADSRFGVGCCAAMLILRVSTLWRSKVVVWLLPTLAMTVLLCLGLATEVEATGQIPTIITDDLVGRLMFSGRLLAFWTWPEWLALEPSSVYVADTGYAYVVNGLGLGPALMLLAVHSSTRHRTDEAEMMKAMISLYFATGLCIGASVFTIKTGSLLWFLYGAAAALPVRSAGRLSRAVGSGSPDRAHVLVGR